MSEETTSNAYAAFMSYVHKDDEREERRITNLRRNLADEVGMLTGVEFPIYQDREDINLGQRLEGRIDTLIEHSTFLIAIITPSFLKSEMCRKEVNKFLKREQRLNRDDLIISILYLPTPSLTDKHDDIARILSNRLYFPWEELRFEESNSNAYRRAINSLAKQIIAAIRRSEESEGEITEAEFTRASDEDDSDDSTRAESSDGVIELLADLETAMPLFEQTILELKGALEELSSIAELSKAEMEIANQSHKPASAKLVASRQFAKRLDGPAMEMDRIADDYMDHLLRVDRGMEVLIGQLGKYDDSENVGIARDLLRTLNNLVLQSGLGIDSLEVLQQTFGPLYDLSSTLRPPLDRMTRAIRKIIPSRNTFIKWRDGLTRALELHEGSN